MLIMPAPVLGDRGLLVDGRACWEAGDCEGLIVNAAQSWLPGSVTLSYFSSDKEQLLKLQTLVPGSVSIPGSRSRIHWKATHEKPTEMRRSQCFWMSLRNGFLWGWWLGSGVDVVHRWVEFGKLSKAQEQDINQADKYSVDQALEAYATKGVFLRAFDSLRSPAAVIGGGIGGTMGAVYGTFICPYYQLHAVEVELHKDDIVTFARHFVKIALLMRA